MSDNHEQHEHMKVDHLPKVLLEALGEDRLKEQEPPVSGNGPEALQQNPLSLCVSPVV